MSVTAQQSDLQLGIEVEYPEALGPQMTMRKPAESSFDILNDVRDSFSNTSFRTEGNVMYDGTAGFEVASPVLDADDAHSWFDDAITELRTWEPYEPTGLSTRGDPEATSFGLHIHLSPLTDKQAKRLAEMSQEAWMQLFVCSSITAGSDYEEDVNYSVFRNNDYCRLENFNTGHYDVVHQVGYGTDHWEWRLPEPVTVEHFGLIVEFLEKFYYDDPETAREFALDYVQGGNTTLTSFARAERVGVPDSESLTGRFESARGPVYSGVDASLPNADWHNDVYDESSMPRIYRVTNADTEKAFFAFTSDSYSEDDEFKQDGVTFSPGDVLRADSLTEVTDPDLEEQVYDAILTRNTRQPPKTKATERLSEILAD